MGQIVHRTEAVVVAVTVDVVVAVALVYGVAVVMAQVKELFKPKETSAASLSPLFFQT